MRAGATSLVLLIAVLLVNAQDPCVLNSTVAACSTYRYPPSEARQDLKQLCAGMMANMPGCSLDRMCQSTDRMDVKESTYCEPFAILKEVCTDMPMSGCGNYTRMCAANTVVEQCSTPMVALPTTERAKNFTRSICMEMSMDGCDECTKEPMKCDWLSTYSNLCLSMPDMTQCSAWKKMCVSIPTWPLCSISTTSDVVEMRMYFHTDYRDYILFKQWVPKDDKQYALSILAVFVISLLYEFLKVVRSVAERKWEKEFVGYAPLSDGMRGVFFAPFRFSVDVPRALLHFLEVMWGLFVMLIAMTYNVGLVVTIGVGAAVGTLLFGRYMKYDSRSSSTCH